MPDLPVSALPLLLDTDIGTDIDDVYALILAATSPEFDLRAVTVVNCDVLLRARLARRALDLLGRNDVPVAIGQGISLTPGERRGWVGHEGLDAFLSDEDALSDGSAPDAARQIAECAEAAHAAGTPLTVCPIGAMTNIALALRCYPESARKIGQIIAMASDFGGFGAENARHEHNIACDPVAADIVLRSGLPVTLIGLNVTQQTRMTLSEVEALEAVGGPLAEYLAGMHRVWLRLVNRDESAMHDGLTLAHQIAPSPLTLTDAVAEVIPCGPQTGFTRFFSPDGTHPTCRVATAVDADAYHALLQDRVLAAVRKAKG